VTAIARRKLTFKSSVQTGSCKPAGKPDQLLEYSNISTRVQVQVDEINMLKYFVQY
jgi:hypothetical protein